MTRQEGPESESMHSKKTLANRARKLRGLGREIGGESRVIDRGSEPDGPADYVALEASGYKVTGGVAMTTRPGESEWFLDMAAGFAAEGRFHVLTLEVGDTTVAMECLIRSGSNLSLVKWSYDERYTKYSPGAALHHATQTWFQEETDASTLDVCTFENNEFALGEYPERRRVSTTVIGLQGARDGRWLQFLKADRYLRGDLQDGRADRPQQCHLARAVRGRRVRAAGLAPVQVGVPITGAESAPASASVASPAADRSPLFGGLSSARISLTTVDDTSPLARNHEDPRGRSDRCAVEYRPAVGGKHRRH